jgi:hypothetical protein
MKVTSVFDVFITLLSFIFGFIEPCLENQGTKLLLNENLIISARIIIGIIFALVELIIAFVESEEIRKRLLWMFVIAAINMAFLFALLVALLVADVLFVKKLLKNKNDKQKQEEINGNFSNFSSFCCSCVQKKEIMSKHMSLFVALYVAFKIMHILTSIYVIVSSSYELDSSTDFEYVFQKLFYAYGIADLALTLLGILFQVVEIIILFCYERNKYNIIKVSESDTEKDKGQLHDEIYELKAHIIKNLLTSIFCCPILCFNFIFVFLAHDSSNDARRFLNANNDNTKSELYLKKAKRFTFISDLIITIVFIILAIVIAIIVFFSTKKSFGQKCSVNAECKTGNCYNELCACKDGFFYDDFLKECGKQFNR